MVTVQIFYLINYGPRVDSRAAAVRLSIFLIVHFRAFFRCVIYYNIFSSNFQYTNMCQIKTKRV